jgi:hypothetical protein
VASQYQPMPLSRMVDLVEFEARARHLSCDVHWQGRRPVIRIGQEGGDARVQLTLDDEVFLLDTDDGYELVASEVGATEQRELIQELVIVISKYLRREYRSQRRRGLLGVRNIREVGAGATAYVFREARASK